MTQQIDAGAIAENIGTAVEQPAVESVEAAPVETPVAVETAPVEEKVQDNDFLRKFNLLSRKERELINMQQELKSKYGAVETYEKERELLKKDPLQFLEKNGWKFNDLADYVLNNNKPTPDKMVSELQQRIDQLEAERRQEIEDRQKAQQQEKESQILNQFKENLRNTISSKSEQYELINHFGEYDTVYEVIENYYQKNGVVLDFDKAAAEVEQYLEQQFEKAAATNKFKKKFNLEQPATLSEAVAQKSQTQGHQPVIQEPATLTNDVYSNSSSPTEPASSYLSDDESKARAAEILREHLLARKGYVKKT